MISLSDIGLSLTDVLEQEEQLRFQEFKYSDALQIVNTIVDVVKRNYEKPVTIHIEYDNTVIAHYLMDGRQESDWIKRKINTVIESAHSSLYTWLQVEQNSIFKAWSLDERYAVCGGGFPLWDNDQLKGCIIVSGLPHLDDHKVIVYTLSLLMNFKQL